MSVLPDISALAANAVQNAATGALFDLIRGQLGGRPAPDRRPPEPAPAEPRQQAPPPVDPPEPVDPLEDLLRRGIEKGLEGLL